MKDKYSHTIMFTVALLAVMVSCQPKSAEIQDQEESKDQVLFKRLSSEETEIDFINQITEDEKFNHILNDAIFTGGGVAVIDINNDGLQDLYFAGNMVDDKLYLNKGNLKFEDITANSGIKTGTWSTGATVGDVNGDGFLDLYVAKYLLDDPEQRRNHLYINNGDLTFTERAAEYGVDHDGHCAAANFFDFDKDGDLDLYIGNQPYVKQHDKLNKDPNIDKTQFSDRLYRNEGNGSFTDVTDEAGITNYNYTLSATVSDLNNDGWPDIYVASDYEEPDYYYQNNGDGTFTNVIHKAMRHLSNFSMGADIADINNDGWMDIYVADMAPADNYRTKANMSGMNPEKFWALARAGYHFQYMYNTLQLNNGNGTFSEIAHMAGVAKTDWSWAPLFADFDNDGYRDLYVTNGQLRDTRNVDYVKKRNEHLDSLANIQRAKGLKPQVNALELLDLAPYEKLPNYIFRNNGDLTFSDKAVEWGMPESTWTQGAAYVDLDNDGDLDLIAHNMNDPAFIYENKSNESLNNHFISVKLLGDHGANYLSYGARVTIFYKEEIQVSEVSPVRGYRSSCDPVLHFGLGKTKKIDRLVAQWPDGRFIELKDVPVDQILVLNQKDAKNGEVATLKPTSPFFKDVTLSTQIDYFHFENQYDDYATEILLPHRMSRLGPCAATVDVDGDGLEDLYAGGAAGMSGILYLQKSNNVFSRNTSQPWQADQASEDINALFFDIEGDGDPDLYVVSGGNEFQEGDAALQDRLYINDGKGNFQKALLPDMGVSGGVVKAGDVDGDGDQDLFVGGRQVPGQYGFPAKSFLLINDGGKFSDKTNELAPDLLRPGMVTDAHWMDLDNDNDLDLFVVGEWMPISVFINDNGKLHNATAKKGLSNTTGWWNRLAAADFDNDGDDDLIVGNLGLNIKFKASEEHPFKVKVKDFDGNGTNDVYLAYYDQDGVLYPVRGRQCSSQQMPFIKSKFKNYDTFAKASYDEVLGELAEGAVAHEAKLFESVYLENIGNGRFNVHKLPIEAQIAPIFGILTHDWNGDGHLDALVAGNYYEREVETTRSDAGIGTVLIGDGKGNFKAASPTATDIIATLDVRSLATIINDHKAPLVFILNNNNGMQVYEGQKLYQ